MALLNYSLTSNRNYMSIQHVNRFQPHISSFRQRRTHHNIHLNTRLSQVTCASRMSSIDLPLLPSGSSLTTSEHFHSFPPSIPLKNNSKTNSLHTHQYSILTAAILSAIALKLSMATSWLAIIGIITGITGVVFGSFFLISQFSTKRE